jgi:hypothetical protein
MCGKEDYRPRPTPGKQETVYKKYLKHRKSGSVT